MFKFWKTSMVLFTKSILSLRSRPPKVQHRELLKETEVLRNTEMLAGSESRPRHTPAMHTFCNLTPVCKESLHHLLLQLLARERSAHEILTCKDFDVIYTHSQILTSLHGPNYGHGPLYHPPVLKLEINPPSWRLALQSQFSPPSTPFCLSPMRSVAVTNLP